MDRATTIPVHDAILALEMQVWQALVTGDAQADSALLADRFLGVYADGFAGKADHVAQLAHGPTVREFTLTETRFRDLGPDHVLVSYRAEFRRPGRAIAQAMYVSSIWERSATGWVNIFSQDTPA